MTPDRGVTVRSYFDMEAAALYQKFRTIEKLLPSNIAAGSSHAAEEGRHIESLLRDFLNRHLPKQLHAYSGFILRPSTKTGTADFSRLNELDGDQHSTQLDVIVFDRHQFPIYEQFEEFVIAPPEGVVGIVSVKKRLYAHSLCDEFSALQRAGALCASPGQRGPYLGLFAFTSAETYGGEKWSQVISGALLASLSGVPFNELVNEVTIMDHFVALKWGPPTSTSGYAHYARCDVSDHGRLHMPVQRLLQSILGVYYSRVGLKRPGFTSFQNDKWDGPVIAEVPYCERLG